MKYTNQLSLFIAFSFFSAYTSQAQEYIVTSPSDNLSAIIVVEENVALTVFSNGKELFKLDNLAMTIAEDDKLFQVGKVKDVSKASVEKTHKPIVPIKSSEVVDKYNLLRLDFKKHALEFRVYDEGIAYRFVGSSEIDITINSESLEIDFAEGTTVYFPEEQSHFSHNERYYQHEKAEKFNAGQFCSLPMLAEPHGVNVLITESNLDDYAGMWLKKGKGANEFHGVFPKYPKSLMLTSDRDEKVGERENYLAKTQGKRAFPWRIFAIAEKDKDLLTNQLSWILSAENQIEDTSWIKPGKVAWDWWNYNNIYGVDFEAGVNTETYKHYIDFAAEYGLEYIILDEGWYKLGDLMAVVSEVDMDELASYAKEKGVGLVMWVVWKTLDNQLEEVLDQFEKWDVKGLKVDFMQRDDQWMVNYYERISKAAAEKKMFVDFHGSYKPAGLHRKYPNVLTREGVCGLEHSKWTDQETPEHNVTIPFIRMVAGPLDYTPGAMLNASEEHFSANFNRPMSLGTRCHQLAMYLIYESPLQMLADSPSNYRREPAVMDFLSPVPTVWDETIAIEAKVGDYVIMARRSGKEWYVGGMTDWEARAFDVSLDFLEKGKKYNAMIFQDGKNAHRYAGDFWQSTKEVDANSVLKMKMASGGGWVARIIEK
jgi:alpha-glucosidase